VVFPDRGCLGDLINQNLCHLNSSRKIGFVKPVDQNYSFYLFVFKWVDLYFN